MKKVGAEPDEKIVNITPASLPCPVMDLSDQCGKTPLLPPPSAERENPGERKRDRERSDRKGRY